MKKLNKKWFDLLLTIGVGLLTASCGLSSKQAPWEGPISQRLVSDSGSIPSTGGTESSSGDSGVISTSPEGSGDGSGTPLDSTPVSSSPSSDGQSSEPVSTNDSTSSSNASSSSSNSSSDQTVISTSAEGTSSVSDADVVSDSTPASSGGTDVDSNSAATTLTSTTDSSVSLQSSPSGSSVAGSASSDSMPLSGDSSTPSSDSNVAFFSDSTNTTSSDTQTSLDDPGSGTLAVESSGSASIDSSSSTSSNSSLSSSGLESSPGGSGSGGACSLNHSLQTTPTILLLSPRKEKSLQISGRGSMNVRGTVYVNSKGRKAVEVKGPDLTFKVDKLEIVGSYSVGRHADLVAGEILTGVSPMEDPLMSLPEPDCSSLPLRSNKKLSSKGERVLDPGRYGGGIRIKSRSHVKMNPGIYSLLGGGLKLHDATLIGEGVLIYNGPGKKKRQGIDLAGRRAHVKLSPAPILGCETYSGITIFQERDSKKKIKLSADDLDISGMIYAPKARVIVKSRNEKIVHPFSQLIANRLRVRLHESNVFTNPAEEEVLKCFEKDADDISENHDLKHDPDLDDFCD